MNDVLKTAMQATSFPSVEEVAAYWNETADRALELMDRIRRRHNDFVDAFREAQIKPAEIAGSPLKWVMDSWIYWVDAVQRGIPAGTPFMLPCEIMPPMVKEQRKPTEKDNIFTAIERQASEQLVMLLNACQDFRDASDEFLLKDIYQNPWLKAMFPPTKPEAASETTLPPGMTEAERDIWLDRINKGGIPAGIVRAMVMVAGTDRVFDEREFEAAARILRESQRFENMSMEEFKQLSKEQACILQIDEERALNALRRLLPQQTHRREAYEVAEKISMADFAPADPEKALLEKLKTILQIDVELESPALAEAPSEEMQVA